MPIVTFTVRAREARRDPSRAGAGGRRTTIGRPGSGDETAPPALVFKTLEVYNTEGL